MGSAISRPGRSYESDYDGVSRSNVPSSWNVIEYGGHPEPEPTPDTPSNGVESMADRMNARMRNIREKAEAYRLAKEEAERKSRAPPLMVEEIDLCSTKNAFLNYTDEYEIVKDKNQLVVRRGNVFEVKVTLDREYDESTDKIIVCFQIGPAPKVSKGTEMRLSVKDGLKKRHWGLSIKDIDGTQLTLQIQTPPTCFVGKWSVIIDTYTDHEDSDKTVCRCFHPHPIYVLFNAWCKDDQVYLENEDHRDEYVMNDTGRVYTGNYKQPWGKPWVFGQFEESVLDCSMWLLDLVKLKPMARGDPVQVTRALSAIVNSQDDNGVLYGNWSGNYEGGRTPTAWTGSSEILEQFYKTQKPVKYGQCWVFSGLVTTVCRSLGMPARSVTNFSSAHDSDGNMSIDIHWDKDGEPIDRLNDDSVWNFHVWNEAWMTRPSLPKGYGGWQAFDATPQETSGGVYCAGPAPVNAIREGNVTMPHDAAFIFAEVNADKLHWVVDEPMLTGSSRTCSKKQTDVVGRRVSTHKPRHYKRNPDEDDRTYHERLYNFAKDKDRMDITLLYKYPEGSENERAALYRARSTVDHKFDAYSLNQNDDVKFDIVMQDHIMVGSPFDVVLKLQNTSASPRTVVATITLTAVYYTGIVKGMVKKNSFTAKLERIKGDEMRMRISPEDYLHLVVDQVSFRIAVLSTVKETKQIHADQEDYRLRRPDLDLEIKQDLKVGEEANCKVQFQNSMPVHLTQCYWLIEGPGLQKSKKISQRNIEPFDKVEIDFDIKPMKTGERTLVASFNSKELMDVTGRADINVTQD